MHSFHERTCQVCNSAIETEFHFLLVGLCPSFDHLRQEFIPPYFYMYPSEIKSKLLMSKGNMGIKHVFLCINVCQVPREMLKTEAEGRDFQQLPRDLANVNALENNV